MTDPKEAAVQRLAVEFLKHEEKEYGVVYPGSAMYDSILAFARIAIEQGVEKVWTRANTEWRPGTLNWPRDIPWDAVCPPKVTDGA